MTVKINVFVVLRGFLGIVFIISGAEKLLSPVENFIYIIQSYELIDQHDLIEAVALIFPWIELFTGVFLALGLWTREAVTVSGLMGAGFVVFVGQAISRGLPLTDCGCFGDLVQWPLWVTFVLDWVILGVSILLYFNIDQTRKASLDRKLA